MPPRSCPRCLPAVKIRRVTAYPHAGLGELVQTYVTTKNGGGSLKLINVTKRLKNLLVVTKLLTVFDTYDNEAAAIASFGQAAA